MQDEQYCGHVTDNTWSMSQVIQQPIVLGDQPPQFKNGDRVVAFDKMGNHIHGTVRWTGKNKGAQNLVGIQTVSFSHLLYWQLHSEIHPNMYNVPLAKQKLGNVESKVVIIMIVHTSSFAHSATSFSFALLPDCVHFSCSSPIASASASCCMLPDYVRFSCCSPIASASAAAPWLHPLQLLLDPRLCPLQLPSRVLEGSNPCTSIRRVRGSV